MKIVTFALLGTMIIGASLIYQDVNDRIEKQKLRQERQLALERQRELAACELQAARLKTAIDKEPELQDHLQTGLKLVERLKGWRDQAKTNMPPDWLDVGNDMDSQIRAIGRENTERAAMVGQLESLEAYIVRLQDGANVQIGMCN